MAPQDMWLWPGLELVGCARKSRGCPIKNYVVYHVREVDERGGDRRHGPALLARPGGRACVRAARGPASAASSWTTPSASKMLRLSHAQCYFAVQGRTIADKRLLLLDTRHRHFSDAGADRGHGPRDARRLPQDPVQELEDKLTDAGRAAWRRGASSRRARRPRSATARRMRRRRTRRGGAASGGGRR